MGGSSLTPAGPSKPLPRSQQQVLGASGAHPNPPFWALRPRLPGEQVLLSLSDEDLELGLGVCSSLHRRKLRLAIEDYRDAEAGRRWVGPLGTLPGLGSWEKGEKSAVRPPDPTVGGKQAM